MVAVRTSSAAAGILSGTAEKIENCRLAVHLSDATPLGHTLLDVALYLPKCWSEDPARRAEAGVPDTVAFATPGRPVTGMAVRTGGYSFTDTSGGISAYNRVGSGPSDEMLVNEVSSMWVYICYGGAKFRSPDATAFGNLGLSWDAARVPPDGGTNAMAEVPQDGTMLRELTAPYVYRVESGRERPVTLAEFTANKYGAILR